MPILLFGSGAVARIAPRSAGNHVRAQVAAWYPRLNPSNFIWLAEPALLPGVRASACGDIQPRKRFAAKDL